MQKSINSNKKNLSAKLERSLSPVRFAFLKMIAAVATTKKTPIYLVGGFIRDLMLNRPSSDFDLVVEGNAIELAHHLKSLHGGNLKIHKRFGTAIWQIRVIQTKLTETFGIKINPNDVIANLPSSIDFVSARREIYDYPAALPDVKIGSIDDDLERRDFTINTLAVRLDGSNFGELLDNWGAIKDIQDGVIRVLHSSSFIDDPTRIFRAIKFEQRLDFKIDENTFNQLESDLIMIDQLSGDRIRHEISNIITSKHPAITLARLDALNILSQINPNLKWTEKLSKVFNVLPPDTDEINKWGLHKLDYSFIWPGVIYVAWLSLLESHEADTVIKRLNLSQTISKAIHATNKLRSMLPKLAQLSNGEIEQKLTLIPPLSIYSVHLDEPEDNIGALLIKHIEEWQHSHPILTGNDLQSFGIEPGPEYKRILSKLRIAKINAEIPTRSDEINLVKRLMNE